MKYANPTLYDQRTKQPNERYIHTIWDPILIKTMQRHITPQTVVCDLGCGTLEHTQHMQAAKHIFAVDSSQDMLEGGKHKMRLINHKTTILVEDALHTSIPSHLCDIVWSVGLTEYVHLQSFWQEIDRVAKPSATVIIQFPNAHSPHNLIIKSIKRLLGKPVKQFRTLTEMDTAAQALGWKRSQAISCGMILPLPQALAHLAGPLWPLAEALLRPCQPYLPIGLNVLIVYTKAAPTK